MIENNIAIFVHDTTIHNGDNVYEDFALGLTKNNYQIKVLNNPKIHQSFIDHNIVHESEENVDLSIALNEFCNRYQQSKTDKFMIFVINIRVTMSLENFNINSQLRRIAATCPNVWIVSDPIDIESVSVTIAGQDCNSIDMQRYLSYKVLQSISHYDLKVSNAIANGKFPVKLNNVLVIGSGGREHAIVHSLIVSSPQLGQVYVSSGNFGTAFEDFDKCQNVLEFSNFEEIIIFVKQYDIALVIVGPEQPLCDGLCDLLKENSVPCFGPCKRAANIEGSKAWSKDFMKRNNIPTAAYETFTDIHKAEEYIRSVPHRVVVKASGLAAGKGVLIPVDMTEAIEAARDILERDIFGAAGREIVIEEFIEGEEISVLAFCDGTTAVGMPPAQDHKRALDGDQGLNTGGMGAYSPSPLINTQQYKECMEIVQKTVTAMAVEECPFVGVLYAGFMLTKKGPMVLEYNCRFGDPETQVLLPLLDSDLYTICMQCIKGNLSQSSVSWKKKVACTVVCAAPGYPEKYPKGLEISGFEKAALIKDVKVFHAGTALSNQGKAITSGGRVFSVTGLGLTLNDAVAAAYKGVASINFEGKQFRSDIAKRGLNKPLRIGVIGSTRGTDMQAVIDSIEQGTINAKIELVISNKSSAGILGRAMKHNIRTLHISALNKTREEHDKEVNTALEAYDVDIILMIGYMRIVSSVFTSRWHQKCFNVHPSLLPEFAGGMDLEVHAAVIAAKKLKSGCTIHFVTELVDGGPIVLQKECSVDYPEETPESLKAKVQQLEGLAFVEAIQMFIDGEIVTSTLNKSKNIENKVKDFGPDVLTYQAAGVDIDAGEALVEAIKPFCKATRRSGCDTAELGGFGGLFDLAQSGYDPADTVLVSGTDGVGTKLKIAQAIGKHDTIGIDLVAMCVNDILVCGAEPLFFLDYYATGILNVEEATQVVKGIAEGCKQSGCALIGGETAEMAGMYKAGEYDLAGFSVGAVRKGDMLPRNDITAGDVLIGLRSSGIHSNGFSLVRKCVEKAGLELSDAAPFLTNGTSLGEALLAPTKIYVKDLLPLVRGKFIKAMAHITGGGLLDNIPRVLPDNLCAIIDINAKKTSSNYHLPPVFKWLQSIANLPQDELLRTFNCGIGMVLVVDHKAVPAIMQELYTKEDGPIILGRIDHRNNINDPQVVVHGIIK